MTGGAWLDSGKVCWGDMTVSKLGYCLNSEAVGTKRSPSTLFSPIFSLAREKIGPPEAKRQ